MLMSNQLFCNSDQTYVTYEIDINALAKMFTLKIFYEHNRIPVCVNIEAINILKMAKMELVLTDI